MAISLMKKIRHQGGATLVDLTPQGDGGSVSWGDINGKPDTFAPVIGTTATTAMAGNKTPTTSDRGGVLQQAAIADLTAAPTQANFNALLAALRSAGVLASN